MLLGVLFLLFLTSQEVSGLWGDGSQDPTYSHLGFYQKNLTCNDAGTTCQLCYTAHAHDGKAYLHVIQYTTEPYKLEFANLAGRFEDKYSIIQDDPNQTFRLCSELQMEYSPMRDRKLVICLDTRFPSGVVVPETCASPIAVTSLHFNYGDKEMRGQQVLVCKP
ncbi:uncharacterized protein LOC119735531 [Patiria miniata]|uniref:Uncharacterized protein n=1 Tax=Patiria miniata TaxID=46514 RepID=A0A914AP27_PATMI|nr:uncharacterized protein LOC119735531 [Patiria miniata]